MAMGVTTRPRGERAPREPAPEHATARVDGTVRDQAVTPPARRSTLGNRATEALVARLRVRAAENRTDGEALPDAAVPDAAESSPAAERPVEQATESEPAPGAVTAPDAAVAAPGYGTAPDAAVAPEPLAGPDAGTTPDAGAPAPDAAEVPVGGTAGPTEAGVATAPPAPGDLPVPVPDAAATAPADDAPAAVDSAPADGGALAPGPELQDWRSRVGAAAQRLPTPELARAPAAAAAVRGRGGALRQSRAPRRAAIRDEAAAATSDAPRTGTPPPAPPPDPVPEATALVEAQAGRTLPVAQMPDLERSPRGSLPLVRDPAARRPPPEPAPEQGSPPKAARPGGPPAPAAADTARVEGIEAAVAAPAPDVAPGTAEGATIEDCPPEPRPPLPPQVSTVMREVIARLLVDPAPQAEQILAGARQEAYPGGVLARVYPDIGAERLAGLTDALSGSLRAVATEAGIAADELEAAVGKRRAAVAAEADAAAVAVAAAGAEETGALEQESGAEVGEVEAAEAAEKARTGAVLAAAAGEGSSAAVTARADEQIRTINRRAGTLRFDYDRARDRRHQALDRALAAQAEAYDRTATEDQAAITGEPGSVPTPSARLEAAGIRNWADGRRRAVTARVRELKGEATTDAGGFTGDVARAADTAVAQVRAWATARSGETRSWWEELWASFQDWSQRAQAEAESWAVVRAGEARDATVQNMGVLQAFVDSQGEAVDVETNAAFQSLSKEEQAVVRAYYAAPPGNRDALGAVAAGLAFRLAAEHRATLVETMRTQVLDKPDSEAWNLEEIGRAESPFSAETISTELYQAMFGGVTGWGTDEEQIYRNLSGLTKLQGRAVRAMYRMDHGSDLDDDLASELDEDNALVRARAALEGDPVLEAVGALNEAMHGGLTGVGTDEDTIMRMLRGKTAEQRAQIEEEYFRRYRVRLATELDSEMDDHDQERAEALLAGDTHRADAIALDQAMHGGFLGLGTDEAQVESVYGDIRNDVAGEQAPDGKGGMRPLTQEEMEAEVARRNLQVEASYDDRYGSPGDQESALRAAYRDELSGPELDLANALADNDPVGADAARLEIEKRGVYTDDDVVNGVLENQYGRALEGLRRDPAWRERRAAIQKQAQEEGWDPYRLAAAERALDREMEDAAKTGGAANMAALETRYDSSYSRWGHGGLRMMIALNMSGTDQEKARVLLEHGGHLTRAQRIDFATRGAGTDEAEFDRAVAGATAAEIAEINRELGTMGRPTVQSLARSELSGREEHDMDIRLRGVPETAQEELHQADLKVGWELRNSPVGGHERDVMTARLARMQRQYALINDPEADPVERRRALAQFQARGTGVQAGVEAYRAQVDAVTDAVATVAALTAAIAVTALTGGLAGAVLGALYAAVVSMAVKSALKGAAYGGEEMAVDAVVGLVDAAAAAATFGVGNALLRVASSQGGRLSRVGGTRVAGVLSRMATSGSRAQRMIAHGVAEAVEGAAGALPSALAGNVLNDQNWEHGNPLLNIVGGTLTETGMGAAMGGVMGSFGGVGAPHVEAPTPRTGDVLAHRGPPADRLAAWKAHQAENPGADMQTFLRRHDEQVAARLAAESRDATVQQALRGELLSGLPPAQRGQFAGVPVEVMSDADFRAFTRSESGNAVTLIVNGEPRVVLRDGAPPSALREEGIHLGQLADPELGPLVRRLDEARLGNWDDLPLAEKLELYALKVDLEIDAQRMLIDGLDADIRRAGPGADVSPLRRQREVAADSLGNLRRRAEEVADLGPLDRIAMARGLRDPPGYLDQPARLFSKSAPEVGDVVDDSPLLRRKGADEEVRIVRPPEVETSEIRLTEDARIDVVVDGTPHRLEVRNGKLSYAGPPERPVPPGTTFQKSGQIPEFTYSGGRTVDVKQEYRVVERVHPDPAGGPPWVVEIRGEANALSHSSLEPQGWQQRGSEIVHKGRAAELASQRVSTELVASSELVGTFQVQRADGTGFDGIEVRIVDGRPILTVVEVKNYPGTYADYESFTAVSTHADKPRGNLVENIEALDQRLTPTEADLDLARTRASEAQRDFGLDDVAEMTATGPTFWQARAAEFEGDVRAHVDQIMADKLGLTPDAYRHARGAMDDRRLELLIRVTPTTSVGQSGHHNAFGRLRADWEGLTGDAAIRNLRAQRFETMLPGLLEQAEAAVRAMADLRRAGVVSSEALRYAGLPGAAFADLDGNLLDVRHLGAGDLVSGTGPAAHELRGRLTTPVTLPSGTHRDVRIVVDLTDLPGARRAATEGQIRADLVALGLTQAQLERLVFVHQRR